MRYPPRLTLSFPEESTFDSARCDQVWSLFSSAAAAAVLAFPALAAALLPPIAFCARRFLSGSGKHLSCAGCSSVCPSCCEGGDIWPRQIPECGGGGGGGRIEIASRSRHQQQLPDDNNIRPLLVRVPYLFSITNPPTQK